MVFELPDDLQPSCAGAALSACGGCAQRARLAGGDLSVESEPGDGTVISVGAPCRRTAAAGREGGAPPPAAAASDTWADGAVEGFTWQ